MPWNAIPISKWSVKRVVVPTVVVMDVVMPKMDGIAATRLVKTEYPQIAAIGLTREPKDYIYKAPLLFPT